MNVNEISISVEEYKTLLEAQVRIKVFSEFVIKEKYSIERKDCASFLGFELPDPSDGEKM